MRHYSPWYSAYSRSSTRSNPAIHHLSPIKNMKIVVRKLPSFMPLPGHANDSVIDAAFRSSSAGAEMTRTNTVDIRSDTLATQNTSCSSYPQLLPADYP
jgi:hypothetical protein